MGVRRGWRRSRRGEADQVVMLQVLAVGGESASQLRAGRVGGLVDEVVLAEGRFSGLGGEGLAGIGEERRGRRSLYIYAIWDEKNGNGIDTTHSDTLATKTLQRPTLSFLPSPTHHENPAPSVASPVNHAALASVLHPSSAHIFL